MNEISTSKETNQLNCRNPQHNNFFSCSLPLNVNRISYSFDKYLLIISTNFGYQIYSAETHKMISSNNQLGSLSFATTYFRSYMIFFTGEERNAAYPPNNFYIYDDSTREIMGKIALKESINNSFVSKNIIFLFVKDNLFLFEIKTLKFITKISNLYYSKNSLTFSKTDENLFSFVIKDESSIIKIMKYEFTNDSLSLYSSEIKTNFKFVQALSISPDQNFIIVTAFLGNKIHIYSIAHSQLIYCLYTGSLPIKMQCISLDVLNSFLLILQKDNNKLLLYKITEFSTCVCENYNDQETIKRKESIENQSFIKEFFSDIKDKYFSEKKESFDDIQINDVKEIIFGCFAVNNRNKRNQSNNLSQVEIFYSNGKYCKYEFNRNQSKCIHLIDCCHIKNRK